MIKSQIESESQDKGSPVLQATDADSGQLGGGGRLGSLAKLIISSEALRALPADFVKRHRVLPFKIHNGTLHIATAEPGNQRVIDDIRLLSGLEVEESEAPGSEIAGKDRRMLPGDGRADDRESQPRADVQRSKARTCTTSR